MRTVLFLSALFFVGCEITVQPNAPAEAPVAQPPAASDAGPVPDELKE